MPSNKIAKLEEVLQAHKGEKVLIALQGHPDPDSISSALAHQIILKRNDIETTIAHVEEISHQENKALMKLLDIDFVKYPGQELNFDEFSGYSLVDSQLPPQELIGPLSDLKIISIVDHHDTQKKLKANFLDVDKEAGSTATIYSHYFEALNLFQLEDEETTKLATALMHGIKTDTDNLNNAGSKDYQAIGYLSKFADLELLKKISIQSVSPQTMGVIVSSYQNKIIENNYILAGVGIVSESERDAIPQAATFLLRRAGIDTSLVYGIVGDCINGSFRTTNDGVRPAEFIGEAYPEMPNETYGGRLNQGGFQFPLGPIDSKIIKGEGKGLVIEKVNKYMQEGFYQKLGVTPTNNGEKTETK